MPNKMWGTTRIPSIEFDRRTFFPGFHCDPLWRLNTSDSQAGDILRVGRVEEPCRFESAERNPIARINMIFTRRISFKSTYTYTGNNLSITHLWLFLDKQTKSYFWRGTFAHDECQYFINLTIWKAIWKLQAKEEIFLILAVFCRELVWSPAMTSYSL